MFKKIPFLFSLLTILLFSFNLSATSNLDPPENIRLTTNDKLQNEEQIFLCPTDSNIVIANWRDFRLNFRQVGIGRSIDGGQTWTDSLISPIMQYFYYDSKQSDPTMSVDRLGNFYMCILDYDAFGFTEGSVLSFYRSTDKGLSWTGPVANIPSVQNDIFEDKQFITVDRTGGTYDGNVYCSWTRFGNPVSNPDRIMFVRSIDGAQTFEDTVTVGPVQMSTSCGGAQIDAGQFSIPIVSSNGDVHVFWLGTAIDSSFCSGSRVIKHVASNDGGQTFTYEDTILSISGYTTARGGINTYSQPVGDADITGGPFDGNIYVAFTNRGSEDAITTDVDFIRSADNGMTWTDRIQINDALESNLIDAFHPWLICNEDGVIVVIFYDQRFDSPYYYNFDLLAAYSYDGGETFTTNHRISTASSSAFDLKYSEFIQPEDYLIDNSLNQPVEKVMAGLIGEYIGVTAYHDKIVAIWTDSRDGDSEIYSSNWYLPMLEPRNLAPINTEETYFPPIFKWATSWKNDQDRYRLEISPVPDFSSEVIIRTTDTNFYALDITLETGDYYWRVKLFNIAETDSTEYSSTWQFTQLPVMTTCCTNIRGNIDNDILDEIDIGDLVYYVEYSFEIPTGPAPECFDEADVNADAAHDIEDIVYMVEYMFIVPIGPQPKDCPKSFFYRYTATENSEVIIKGWIDFGLDGGGNIYGTWKLENISGVDPVNHVIGFGTVTGTIADLVEGETSQTVIVSLIQDGLPENQVHLNGLYSEGYISGNWEFFNIIPITSGTFEAVIP